MKKYIQEMRIKCWLKNIFVFCPVFFSKEIFQLGKLSETLVLMIAFCFVSSSVYVLNDINDVEKDRKHDVKKMRPIASGAISFPKAWMLMVCLVMVGLAMALTVNFKALCLILSYFVINVFYSRWLKNIVIVDCFCIASGFILRVMVGGTIVSEGVSNWMFLTVLALSLFMAFGKRRGEMSRYSEGMTRVVLEEYDVIFLNGSVFMCAGLTMIFYSLWSLSQNMNLVYTVPVVLFIISRYLLLVFKGNGDADPTTLVLSDRMLWVSSGICAIIMFVMLYL